MYHSYNVNQIEFKSCHRTWSEILFLDSFCYEELLPSKLFFYLKSLINYLKYAYISLYFFNLLFSLPSKLKRPNRTILYFK